MPMLSTVSWKGVSAVPEHKTIPSYLASVAEQIRWKRARPVVISELQRHLEDQRDAFAAEGYENAEQMAVKEMGDPVSVGLELDAIHRPRPQWDLLILTVALALAGTAFRMWLTAASHAAIDPLKTIIAFTLGCGTLIAGYFLDYARLGRHAGKIYLAALIAGAATLLCSPRVGTVAYYTRSVVLLYPVVYAFWLYACRRKGWLGLLGAILGGIPLARICLLIPHMSSLLLVLLTGFLLLLTAAREDWFGIGRWKSISLPVISAAALAVLSLPRCIHRLDAAFHPEQNLSGSGYLSHTIQKVLQTSRWLGQGSWNTSDSPFLFEQTLPNYDSDTLLTTLICKLGWLPFLAIVLSFTLLIFCLLHRCFQQKSQLGKLVVLSIILPLCVRALCCIMFNLGFTLINLSFPVIFGNLSMMLDMGLIGSALSMLREESILQDCLDQNTVLPAYRIKILIQKCE